MADAEGATLTAPAVDRLAEQLAELDHEVVCEVLELDGSKCQDPARWWLKGRAHECGRSRGGDSLMCDNHYGAVLRGLRMPCPGCGICIVIREYVVEVRSIK